ncbi:MULTISPECIES: paraquat-inducible protein A [Acetobacteraceae]|uniref:Paraquat-inducible protein A n=1 Tax=Bombella apis TaxID=1785988 RepID=A0ABR9MRS6_9PROT|nr:MULTISPECIES: paraquat-inducible protein A [Acetobacteraceae]MCL1563489.1 paraquat-inducible membrane protein A [Parasaccharibacter sp. TMW 2.1886]MUG78661.1 paraquat-inducible membrane protein A [Bombella sp. ESL0380]MBE1724569.1 paraquat-inducible protein A [Bombella apis]MBR9731461.1 paraquat-inducible protein A [Bombella apis]MCK8637795.1 paraquat-inducible membrane protein A [Parasaccharibacter sp. TMW2.1885]
MFRKDHFHKGLWSQGGACSFLRHDVDQPALKVVAGVDECDVCGLFQHVPHLRPGHVLSCARCGNTMARRRRTSEIGGPLVFCLSALALYIVLLVSPLMTLNIYGRENMVTLMSGPLEMARQGYGSIAILVALASVLMPGIVLVCMTLILYGASRDEMPRWVRPLLAWYEKLRPWSMVEVYVIGLLVAYTKLVDLALVILQPGVYLLGGLMVMMAAMDSAFDADMIWRHRSVTRRPGLGIYMAEGRALPPEKHMLSCHACGLVFVARGPVDDERDMGDCPRCGQILRRRKRNSLQAAMCFLVAAFIFYIPANMLPVMAFVKVGHGHPSTIISGVIQLWEAGLYFLALLVLFASITVPVLKVFLLALMIGCECRGRASHKALKRLTGLYKVVVFIGRWSMIDVFMISILAAVVRFGFMASVTAELGVVFFALVVVLTIFAADLYDPRRMWDAAGYNRQGLGHSRQGGEEDVTELRDMEPEKA